VTCTVWCTMSLPEQSTTGQLYCKICIRSGSTSGRQGQWFLHHNNAPSHTALVVSSPNHRTLRISLRVTPRSSQLRKRPQRDRIRNHRGHQTECEARIPGDSKGSLLPVLPAMARWLEPVCVCVCVCARACACVQWSYFEDD
jgi:hypothetical protein